MFQVIEHFQTGLVSILRFVLCTPVYDHLKTEQFVHIFSRNLIYQTWPALCDLREVKRRR